MSRTILLVELLGGAEQLKRCRFGLVFLNQEQGHRGRKNEQDGTKAPEREAREAQRKAREAELNREFRNRRARERRAKKKAAAQRERELSKLIGALGMLGSAYAGERAAAALLVERLRAKLGKRWRDLIHLTDIIRANGVTDGKFS